MGKRTKVTGRPTAASPALAQGAADRLDLLQTYARIVEAGSLSGAAIALGTTQPTVSRRLQQLERLLGRRLVHRSTHGIRLSEEGERCYQRALEVLSGWGEFEAELRGDTAEPSGLLRVLVPHAFGQQLLVGPLAEFLTAHPKISVEWLLRDDAPDFVAEGVDCAILVGEVHDASTVAVKLAEVPRIVVASPSVLPTGGDGLKPEVLSRLPWLSLKTYYHRELVLRRRRGDASVRLTLKPRVGTDNLYALREATLRGLGVALLSSWLVADDIAAGRLVHLVPEWSAESLPVYVIYPYARFYSPQLRAFVDAMRRSVPAALGAAVGDVPAGEGGR